LKRGEVVPSGVAIIQDEVRELVRRRALDPVLEPDATRRLVEEVVADYLDRAAVSTLPPLSVVAFRAPRIVLPVMESEGGEGADLAERSPAS